MNYPTDTNNQPIADSYNNENFFSQVFGLKAKEISQPIVLQDMVIVSRIKTDEQVPDQGINMLIREGRNIHRNILKQDTQQFIVKKDKIVDNVDKTYKTQFTRQ